MYVCVCVIFSEFLGPLLGGALTQILDFKMAAVVSTLITIIVELTVIVTIHCHIMYTIFFYNTGIW